MTDQELRLLLAATMLKDLAWPITLKGVAENTQGCTQPVISRALHIADLLIRASNQSAG